METLLSFKNDKKIKQSLMKRMQDHIKADELLQGATGRDGKGCTVWCALNNGKLKHGYNHDAFPDELGLPVWLGYLIDKIYEGLSVEESKKFSMAWIDATPEGKDLEKVKYQFLKWVLKDGDYNTYQNLREEDKPATDQVYALLLRAESGDMPSKDEWSAANAAANAAAYAAANAAAYAAAYTAAYAAANAAYAAAYTAYAEYYLAASKELLRLLANAKEE
jgi:hypothetical protein